MNFIIIIIIFVLTEKTMKKIARISLLISLLIGQMYISFADRGIGKRKARIILNIKTPSSFNSSLVYNLKNGMKYTGSLINTNFNTVSANQNTLITYQKGNSVYILPYKQKILVADVKQGFAGTKLIIRVP